MNTAISLRGGLFHIFFTVLTVAIPSVSGAQESPHYFEGFYHRFYDPLNEMSVAIIATAHNIENSYNPDVLRGAYRLPEDFKGYVAVFIQHKDRPPYTLNREIDNMRLSANSNPSVRARSNFQDISYEMTSDDGMIRVTERELFLKTPEIQLELQWSPEDSLPWPKSPLTGLTTPEDLGLFLPGVETHWHVFSLGTPAKYQMQVPDRALSVDSTASLHVESNWGRKFPEKWYWIDAVDPDQEVYVSLAGGSLPLAGVEKEAFLIGISTPEDTFDFSPARLGAQYEVVSNDCDHFKFSGWVGIYKFEITATAPSESFKVLNIPTPKGYLPGAYESLRSDITLKVWRGHYLSYVLDDYQFIGEYPLPMSALEFGGALKCE